MHDCIQQLQDAGVPLDLRNLALYEEQPMNEIVRIPYGVRGI